MITNVYVCNTHCNDLSSEVTWIGLYPKLLSLCRRFVYIYWIPCWSGQEEDIVSDIAQETARRVIDRSQKAVRGEATPIDSIERMIAKIALNCVRDLRRHDRRVIRILSDDSFIEMSSNVYDLVSMSEVATENVYHDWLFLQLAYEIDKFPYKQRKAILTDLANRMGFDREPTALQTAFSQVGIDLQAFQRPLPENSLERAQHTSLLYQAYKRLAQLSFLHPEALAA